MANREREIVTNIVNVIEPAANQLLGAYIQYRSFQTYPRPWSYFLVVVQRAPDISLQVRQWARQLGLNCEFGGPPSENPYLNKWLFLDAFRQLRAASQVVLVDWDLIYLADRPLPISGGRILCRGNPADMYRDQILTLPGLVPADLTTDEGDLLSSVNGGVMVADGYNLTCCAEKTVTWTRRIQRAIPACPSWRAEQLALSLSVGQLGLEALDDRWNVTPLSPIDDDNVWLWHYNDGTEPTRALKQQLVHRHLVERACDQLRARWPKTIAAFQGLYELATREEPFKSLLQDA